MAKQGPRPGAIPKQVIPLPDPPSDCGSAVMSDGSITVSVAIPGDGTIRSDEYKHDIDIEHQGIAMPLHVPHHHSHSRPPSVLKSNSLKYKTTHHNSRSASSSGDGGNNNQNTNESLSSSSKKRVTLVEPPKDATTKHEANDISTTDRSTSDDDSSQNRSGEKRRACCFGLCTPTVVYTLFGLAVTATIVAVGINVLFYFEGKYWFEDTSSQTDDGTTILDFTNSSNIPQLPNNPDASIETMMRGILENQFLVILPYDDPAAPTNLALQWLVEEAESASTSNSTQVYDTLERFGQRFALLTMRYALPSSHSVYEAGYNDASPAAFAAEEAAVTIMFPQPSVDECEWDGVSCNADGMVTAIDYSDSNLQGTIPSEIKFLASLRELDLSNNALQGTLPDTMYGLQDMQKIYLYHNQLGGTISRNIGRWDQLEVLHLSRNKFVGPIPEEIQSDEEGFRPLKYLNLYDNRFSGTIPRNLRLRNLYYLDIGRNRFVGTIPEDMGDKMVGLRYLHIDHNRLSGSIPETIPPMANGRLFSLLANDNYLSGRVPDNWMIFDKLTQYTLHNNNFDSLGPANCQFNVFTGGNCVEFTADCDICGCNDIFCARMCGRA